MRPCSQVWQGTELASLLVAMPTQLLCTAQVAADLELHCCVPERTW